MLEQRIAQNLVINNFCKNLTNEFANPDLNTDIIYFLFCPLLNFSDECSERTLFQNSKSNQLIVAPPALHIFLLASIHLLKPSP